MSDPDSPPPSIHQSASDSSNDISEYCPFCTIATHYQPISPSDTSNEAWDPDRLQPPSYVILSTNSVIAFMDIAPLTRGHVLVAPRKHRVKMGDFKPEEMAEIGRVLPILARSVIKAVLPDIPHNEADYNIVQNNGPGAAQVIPHVHFHIVPRPPLNYQPTTTPSSSNPIPSKRKYPPSKIPTGLQQSYIQFGRGSRHELDDEDAAELVRVMRSNVHEEWEREFGSNVHSTSRSLPTSTPAPAPASNSNTNTNKSTTADSAPSNPSIERFMGGVEDAAWIEGSGGLVRNLERRARGGGKL